MNAVIYDTKGKKKSEVALPKVFSEPVREDIVSKYAEVSRYFQPHYLDPRAGRRSSASGIAKHRRHAWKGQYGKGISRIPRKIIWRRGTQFNWVGAEISGTRGGRRVHGPHGLKAEKKINRKEIKLAFASAFAATANKTYINKRYQTIGDHKLNLPIVADSNIVKLKGKEIIAMLQSIFGDKINLVLKRKEVRPGVGKSRGRKYKSNAGLLIVTGDSEDIRVTGIEVKALQDVSIRDLYPLGRLTLYTEKALKELEEKQWN